MGKSYRTSGGSGGAAAPASTASQTAPAYVPSNADLVELLEAEQRMGSAGALRTTDEIAESGVLDAFARLEGVRVDASERDRSVTEDGILVKQGLAKLKPEEITALKDQAYVHDDVTTELPDAIRIGHYGSERHRAYGALVEELTGGVISAEEAMAMNPTGGMPGAGASELPLARHIEPVARHAMRHDATGFLLNRFGVGPGYGSKTTAVGRDSDDPLAGQILGVVREMFTPSELPSAEHVAKPGRFA